MRFIEEFIQQITYVLYSIPQSTLLCIQIYISRQQAHIDRLFHLDILNSGYHSLFRNNHHCRLKIIKISML